MITCNHNLVNLLVNIDFITWANIQPECFTFRVWGMEFGGLD